MNFEIIKSYVHKINEDINNMESERKMEPRKKIQNIKKIYNVRRESQTILKRQEQIDENKLIQSIQIIEQVLNENHNEKRIDSISELLMKFKEKCNEAKANSHIRKSSYSFNIISNILKEHRNIDLKLNDILQRYRNKSGINGGSISSLRNYLNKAMNTKFRNINLYHTNQRRIENKIMNIIFANQLAYNLKAKNFVIYIDESTLQNDKLRVKRWTNMKNDSKIYNKGRGKSLGMIGAISSNALHHIKFTTESNNSESFVKFLKELEKAIDENLQTSLLLKNNKVVVIMDNSKLHTCINTRRYLRKSKFKFLLQPTYTPSVNAIEYLWGFIKKKANRNIMMTL